MNATTEIQKGTVLLSPTLLLMVAALGLPLVGLAVLGFWSKSGMDIVPAFSLENFETIASKRIYPLILMRSIENAAIVAAATVLLAFPAAYFIAFHVGRRKFLWLILITLPFWTSYLLRIFAWKIVLGHNGVINSGLIEIGMLGEPLSFLLHNRWAVVVTLVHAWAAFAVLPIYVSLEKIDRSLVDAAADLGEGAFGQFYRVTLPLALPGVIAAFLLVFIPTVGDYVTPKLVGGASGIMIGNLIQTQFGIGNNWPLGAAISTATMLGITATVCAFLLVFHQFRKRILV